MKRFETIKPSQSGQAMVEFLVSMTAVMSVLFLGIVMLGKFNDVRNRTLIGSRYVAWERTVWTDTDPTKNLAADSSTTEGWSSIFGSKALYNGQSSAALAASKIDSDIQHEVMQRFMGGSGNTPSGSDRQASQLPPTTPEMWRDYGGTPLLASAGDVAVKTGVSIDPSSSMTASAGAPFGAVQTAGAQYTARMYLPTRTLQSATLSVSIGKNNPVLQRLWPKNGSVSVFSGLTFSDTNVLMTNTWVPDGSNSAKAVFSGAVPAAGGTALVATSTYQGLQKYAPEITTLQFGRVQQDVVPANRLSP